MSLNCMCRDISLVSSWSDSKICHWFYFGGSNSSLRAAISNQSGLTLELQQAFYAMYGDGPHGIFCLVDSAVRSADMIGVISAGVLARSEVYELGNSDISRLYLILKIGCLFCSGGAATYAQRQAHEAKLQEHAAVGPSCARGAERSPARCQVLSALPEKCLLSQARASLCIEMQILESPSSCGLTHGLFLMR